MHFVDAKGILSSKNGMNIYRGCTHGCIYCDSRSKCYGFEHAFEEIEVKQNAPFLLEQALRSKRKKCMIGTGAMCDPYMPCEQSLGIMRSCLELIERYEFGATVQTKSDLVLRDLELLERIQRKTKSVVQMTLTTYDEKLCKVIEPNVCGTQRRAEVLKVFRDHEIPTVVWLSPFLPYINDTVANMEGLLKICVEAQVKGIVYFCAGLTLREGNREYFYEQLEQHFPGMKERYCRKFGNVYEILSDRNQELSKIVTEVCRENQILYRPGEVFSYLYDFPENKGYHQLSLFENDR